jgi:hypothetical protein
MDVFYAAIQKDYRVMMDLLKRHNSTAINAIHNTRRLNRSHIGYLMKSLNLKKYRQKPY